MKKFADLLNASAWKGIITEVGLGLEFSSRYLRIPGASNTILGVSCPYDGHDTPIDMRAVSLENAKRLAKNNLDDAKRRKPDAQSVFGLAITGAHYENRVSHGWMYLATPGWEAWLHFSCNEGYCREAVGERSATIASWFLEGCLLSSSIWTSKLDDLYITRYIDVLYGPGISDVERMSLLRSDNALVYDGGQFHRVEDYVRKYSTIYPGSFNPPTKRHLAAGALFELSQKHPYKGSLSIEDMLHRARMLNAAGKPVLLTQAPTYVEKYKLLQQYDPAKKEWYFLMGTDAWNAMIADHQYPASTWLIDNMSNARFEVMPRSGMEMESSNNSRNLKRSIRKDFLCFRNEINSTDVRLSSNPSEHENLTPEVADYIRRMKLYAK